jgi:hypothetical protein
MSSLSRNQMIKNLNEIVVPTLRQLNFKGSFPHFRRITSDRINLLTFQFDRNGGGFVIELANCDTIVYEAAFGRPTPTNKLTAHDFYKRKRIQSNMKTPNNSTDDWFRYDKKYLFGFGDIFKKVCKDVLSKIEVAEDYWENGELN